MKCSACGFDNMEPSERCPQCGAETKKSVYVASVSTGLKRLEKEKLRFLGNDDIPLVSKYSDEDVARFAMMAPMDDHEIDRLAECDETMELKEIASVPDKFETIVLDPDGTDIMTESGDIQPGPGVPTRALPDSREFEIAETMPRSENNLRDDSEEIQDVEAVPFDEIQDVEAVSLDEIQDGDAGAGLHNDDENQINEQLKISLSYNQPTMFDQIQDIDQDVVEVELDANEDGKKPDDAGRDDMEDADAVDGQTMYDEVQSLDALLIDTPEANVSDAPEASMADDSVQDIGAFAIQLGEKSEKEDIVEFRTIFDDRPRVDTGALRAVDEETSETVAKPQSDEHDILKKIRVLDEAHTSDSNHDVELPKGSVYGILPVETVGVTSASESVALTGMDQIPLAEVDALVPKNARILRHDFRVSARAKGNPDASAMEKLKADGVFDTSKSHAEVNRNIDSLILDDLLPRAQYATWHGDMSVESVFDAGDMGEGAPSSNAMRAVSEGEPLAMLDFETSEQKEPTVCVAENKAAQNEKKLAGLKEVSHAAEKERERQSKGGSVSTEADSRHADETVLAPIDIAEEQVVGAVSEAAPDNQTLASIADKIVPKVSGTANAAVTRLSKEIPCPFDADDEKLNDEKLLSSLDEEPEDEEEENEKTELIVRPDMDQMSSLDQLEIKIDEMPQMARKSLSGFEPSKEKGEKKKDGKKASKEIGKNDDSASDDSIEIMNLQADQKADLPEDSDEGTGIHGTLLWTAAFVVLLAGIGYLLYSMGFLASIAPGLDPHGKNSGPVVVSAPAYETSKVVIHRAMDEVQVLVYQAYDLRAYVAQQIETSLAQLGPDDVEKKLSYYQYGREIYPERVHYAVGIAETLLAAKRYADVHAFVSTLPTEIALLPEFQAIDLKAYREDTHFLSPVETIVASDYDNLSPLGGGSTLTFKLIRDGVPVAAVKPLQTRLQSNYRAEIAAWRLCEFLRCDFKVPYNKEIRFEYGTFNLMYAKSRSNKAEAYKKEFIDLRWKKNETDGKNYLYATYKDWVPDFTRFPIELKSVWKNWLSAEADIKVFPELEKALKPIAAYAPTAKLYDDILRRKADLTTPLLASQISQVIVFDFLIGNFDRFSGVPNWYGVNCQFKDGRIVSIDNGAGFQWGGNTKVTENFMLVERFSRHFIEELRRLDRENTCDLLFPERDSKDQASCDQFWKKRQDVLERVDALILKYGEDTVLAFP